MSSPQARGVMEGDGAYDTYAPSSTPRGGSRCPGRAAEQILFMREFPKGATGKVNRSAPREMLGPRFPLEGNIDAADIGDPRHGDR